MMDNPANEHEEPAGEVAAAETRPGDMTSAQQFDLQANLTRIRECRLAGQYEEAQRYCRQILVHDPNNTEAYLLICALFIERGAYQEATSWYRKMTHLKGIENNSKYAAMIAKVFKDKQPGLVIEELIPPEPPRPEPVIPPPIEPAPMPAPERREPSLLPLIISPDPAQGTERVFRSEDRESNVMDSPVNEQNVPAGDMTAAKTELADMPPEPPFELLSILTRIRECRVAGRFEEAQD